MSNKKQKIIILSAILILAGFWLAREVLAGYYSSGTLISTNLLSGETVTKIDSFSYNASSLSGDAGLKVQFSNDDKVTWKNSSGTPGGWNTCSPGSNEIDLSGLGWSGDNFYYKMEFTSSGGTDTPVLDEVSVDFTSWTPRPPGISPSGGGFMMF